MTNRAVVRGAKLAAIALSVGLGCGPAQSGGSSAPDQPQERIPLPPKNPTVSAPVTQTPRDSTKPAPGGVLRDVAGNKVDLKAAYASTPVIVIFFRGDWCRQCRKQLTELQGEYDAMLQKGVHLYVISVDPVDRNKKLKAELKLTFPVLSDAGGKVAREWGVLDEAVGISKPATFVIAPAGAIHYRHIGKDTNDRQHSNKIVDLAAALAPKG